MGYKWVGLQHTDSATQAIGGMDDSFNVTQDIAYMDRVVALVGANTRERRFAEMRKGAHRHELQ